MQVSGPGWRRQCCSFPDTSGRGGPVADNQITVKVQGGIHQALLDSGSNQTLINQSLVQPEALVDASRARIWCIYGDLHDYPLVTLEMYYQVKQHNVKTVVSSRLTCPLLLGADWPGYITLVTRLGDAQS